MLNEEAADILRQLYEVEYNERILVASAYSREFREKFASLDSGEHREKASRLSQRRDRARRQDAQRLAQLEGSGRRRRAVKRCLTAFLLCAALVASLNGCNPGGWRAMSTAPRNGTAIEIKDTTDLYRGTASSNGLIGTAQ